ncbi:putative membrane protein [Desulfosporosinus orientis DSM 765]|uniref:Putative membrane protein n=1 Tax=Desulfosporosinus orientis (strain ATCC 19365 / DSM 765 / NCIMB 8382 / VKM B-1628 / Singapore I) TaxID=768706 RepID=G7W9S1_DESOD|nr:heparan-alpha-glucosaminide N-acetyltransferase [Desulfosporosinus orientis]AET70637.1 putative membrane protein [Desulfosporosinus orientis DSM 765]
MTSVQRYGEIDVLRALAIILMVLFHFVYDLREFAAININYESPLWFVIGKASALIFIFISGLASGLSRSPVRRGLIVFLLGMVVSVVTYLALADMYVRFGILHFLGVAMILFPLLNTLSSPLLLILSGLAALLGFLLNKIVLRTSLLIPFGVIYKNFSTVDYYPLFPYISVTILGILAYRHYYARRDKRLFKLEVRSKSIRWLSRHSLAIYLVHQPILLLIILGVRFLK